MHIALAVGTLLLGSWVLNVPEDEESTDTPEPIQPPAVAPGTTRPSMPYTPMGPRPSRMDRGQGRTTRGPTDATTTTRAYNARRRDRAISCDDDGGPRIFPWRLRALCPWGRGRSTDRANGQWAAGSRSYRRAGRLWQPREPMAPTAQLPGPARAARQMSRALVDMNRIATSPTAAPSIAPPPEKAFSNFRPSSGVSPYMNLFRLQGDSLDNYTSLVRPQIEQRFLNSAVRPRHSRTAEPDADAGGEHATTLRTNETLQGVATPQYYMNTQATFRSSRGNRRWGSSGEHLLRQNHVG